MVRPYKRKKITFAVHSLERERDVMDDGWSEILTVDSSGCESYPGLLRLSERGLQITFSFFFDDAERRLRAACIDGNDEN